MSTLLSFNFLAILNLFILLLWPASGHYSGARASVIGIIMLILTIIAVVFDIVFLVLALAR